MEFRKYKRKIAAMIIGCLLLTNQTNAYGNFIFIDEDIGSERSVASASEATGSDATESRQMRNLNRQHLPRQKVHLWSLYRHKKTYLTITLSCQEKMFIGVF